MYIEEIEKAFSVGSFYLQSYTKQTVKLLDTLLSLYPPFVGAEDLIS